MRLNRFIGDFDFSKKQIRIDDASLVLQIRKVLRLRVGDKLILCDGKGQDALSQVTNFREGVIEVEVLEVTKSENGSKIRAILYCSILKHSNFELVVQKATEVGVAEIVPMITKRTVKLKVKTERLEKIIKEAAEQSGRRVLPTLHQVMKFEEACEHARGNYINLLFDKSGEALNEQLTAKQHSSEAGQFLSRDNKTMKQPDSVGLFIGPEGGWEDSEINIIRNSGFKIVSLGKSTLRAETAAIIASYLVINLNY